MTEEESAVVKEWFLLTTKPVIYAANIAEDDLSDADSLPFVQAVSAKAAEENAEMLVISARIEEEISQMEADEKQEFFESERAIV